MAAERPRRSARVPAKYQEKSAAASPAQTTSKKRKAASTNQSLYDPTSLDFLLTNPKSPLVNMELSTLINENTWSALSQDSRALLSTMLPPTVFPFFQPSLSENHPSNLQCTGEEAEPSRMDLDALALGPEPDMTFFTDPFFEAGAKTFQDHLYSGWLTPTHEALVHEYTDRLKNGETHARWKDDVWTEEHPAIERNPLDVDGPAGDASSISLKDLVKHSIIRVGDVLAYRRRFPHDNLTVAKDVLIESIQPSNHSLTVLVSPSTLTHLPPAHLEHPILVKPTPEGDRELPLRSMTITNPTQLESALLDIDARVEKHKRPRGNAWKSIGMWRWRDGRVPEPSVYAETSEEALRGFREYRGTLFYLRGCFYDEL